LGIAEFARLHASGISLLLYASVILWMFYLTKKAAEQISSTLQ
jgi:hypothetical protein